MKNGALLAKAEAAGFTVLLTGDKNLEYQQNLKKCRLGIVVLGAPSNALEDLLVARTLAAMIRCDRVR